MSFDTDFIPMFAAINNALGSAATVRTPTGEIISTRATFNMNVEVIQDYDSGAIEYRDEISLQREDVGTPSRGWIVVNHDNGKNYEIQNELPDKSDQFESVVSVKEIDCGAS